MFIAYLVVPLLLCVCLTLLTPLLLLMCFRLYAFRVVNLPVACLPHFTLCYVIAYHVMLVVSLLSACLPCVGEKGPSGIVCFFGRDEGVMMGKLCVSLAGEAVIPQWRKRV